MPNWISEDISDIPHENFIRDHFKSLLRSWNCCEKVEFTVDFGQEMAVVSVFLLNFNLDNVRQQIGVSSIRHGNDATNNSLQNTKIVDNITDGGFFEVSQVLSKRYLKIGRD